MDLKPIFRYIGKEVLAIILFIPAIVYLKIRYFNNGVLFIFNYHNFSKYSNYKINRGNIFETGYRGSFDLQIRFLKFLFKFCSVQDFFSQKSSSKINISFTFDDGYKDNYEIAAPILAKYEVPTIFFISSKILEKDAFLMHDKIKYLVSNNYISKSYLDIQKKINSDLEYIKKSDFNFINREFKNFCPDIRLMMNEGEIKDLHAKGFTIGNHTHNHEGLSFLNRDAQKIAIATANERLIELTDDSINHMAFPNGLFNSETLEVLDELELEFGYTVKGGVNRKNDSKKLLKRLGLNVSDSIFVVAFKMLKNSTFSS